MNKLIRILLLSLVMFVSGAVASTPEEQVLFDKEVTALRGDFKEMHFLVPDSHESWEFHGEFRSMGGMHDDITFRALDQSNYVRWFSHYGHKAEAQFEKKKNGKFTFVAKPGETYYFVFDNFFSSVSNKTIHFNLKLVPK